MNELMENSIRMTSLNIAELTGKEHKNVMRDIRNEIEELGNKVSQLIFEPATYINRGKEYPCYHFGKDGAMQLALKYDAKTRYKVIKRIEVLEQTQGFKLPGSYKEALVKLVGQVEANEKLQSKNLFLVQQNNELKPKALFAEAVETSTSSVLVGELAKILKQNGVDIGQNRLFDWLRTNGFLIKKKGESFNQPTQKSMDLSLFEIKKRTIFNPDGSIRTTSTSKVTGKGQVYFVNKLLKEVGVLV